MLKFGITADNSKPKHAALNLIAMPNTFSALDTSIYAQTEKIDQRKPRKQGLMLGLFPKVAG